jgi:hypothetical protein
VRGLIDGLRERYAVLCAMGVVAGGFPKAVRATMPGLPDGPVAMEASAAPSDVEYWSASLTRLEANPMAVLEVPNAQPVPENPPVSFVRSALRRLVCEGE